MYSSNLITVDYTINKIHYTEYYFTLNIDHCTGQYTEDMIKPCPGVYRGFGIKIKTTGVMICLLQKSITQRVPPLANIKLSAKILSQVMISG